MSNVAFAQPITINQELPSLIGTHNAADGFSEVPLLNNYKLINIESLQISLSGSVNVQPSWLWVSVFTPVSSERILQQIYLPESGNFEISNLNLIPGGIYDGKLFTSLSGTLGGTFRLWVYDEPKLCQGECPPSGEIIIQNITLHFTGNNLKKVIVLGDIDGNSEVTLADVIQGLQIIVAHDTQAINMYADVNKDEMIGLAEVAFVLQLLSQTR